MNGQIVDPRLQTTIVAKRGPSTPGRTGRAAPAGCRTTCRWRWSARPPVRSWRLVGTVLVGVFATASTGGSVRVGLAYGGGWDLLGRQVLAVVCTVGYSVGVTLVLAWAIRRGLAGSADRRGNSGERGGPSITAGRWRLAEYSRLARFGEAESPGGTVRSGIRW
jgi:hypothetical protein